MSDFLGQLDQWSALWCECLWRATLQGGIAIAAAWAITHCCHFLSARVRCWVWRMACLKLLVALIWSQPLDLPMLPARPIERSAQTFAAPAEHLAQSRQFRPANEAIPLIVRQSQVDKSEFSLKSVVFLLWGAGVVYCLMRTAQRLRAIIRLRGQSEPVQSIAWLCDLRDEADRMAIRRLPQLRIAPHANTVQLVGIRSPAIVLPAGSLETFSDEERRLILAHELAHLKRRDLTWNWLPTVARSLFFFHPLVWAMVRGWCQSQESACDELVIQCQVNRRASYGRLLLKMSTRWPDERRNVLVAAGISGAYRHLEQRILAMTQVQPHSTPKLVAAAAAAVLIVAGGVIPWRLVAQEPARPAPRSNQGTIAQTQTGAATTISFSGNFSSSSDGSSLSSSTSAIVLPGRLYLRAGVEYKRPNGATGKYSGIMAVDPNSGEWERLDVGGFAVRISPQIDRMAFCQFSARPARTV